MYSIKGYSVLEELYSGEKLIVSSAVRNLDNQPVVLKMLKADYPDPADIARLRYEYDLLKNLSLSEVIHGYAFETQQNRFALVLEKVPNSKTLRAYLDSHQMTIDTFLELAIKLANALDKLHETGIIHKDINPDNILVIGEGEAIKILDLGLATQLQEEQHEITNSESLEGTFPYMSPEQTTRMNRPIDRRTDLYSLGITFYEMLVGQLPFTAKDPIEWVYCHIAKQPISPTQLVPTIPEMLSAIVLKLLAKSAEDRYATAFGLKADLEAALIAWKKNREIAPFELATNDRKGIFRIPQKLYGREQEIQSLMNVFESVGLGHRELLLVSGYTGIGKSSLINEVQKPIVKQNGYFISGKYEKYNREIPYAGLIQAFRHLMHQILSGNKQHIQRWRDEILKVLSPNAQVIINVIPELEKLIGKQPPVVELPPVESRTRFELLFFDFVSVFAKQDHPLVIFVDDLQWADAGSFNLITQLMKNTDLKYFLILGAYRGNEINSTHPLLTMLENLDKDQIHYKQIELKSLSSENLTQIIADTLHTSKGIQSLSDLIMEKTAGNPYFVNLFLTTLYKTQQIKFDPVHDWIFDIDVIKNSPITDNVVDLLINEIGKLTPETQELLKFSTCIGTEFDLNSLIEMTDKTAEVITSLLWPAVKEKWIIQLGESYQHITKDSYYDAHMNIRYRFSHDNVKHTLYSLTDPAIREKLHYKLGKSLLKDYLQGNEENLFVIAQHFSQCLNLIHDPAEKAQIAKVFNHAADQMKLSISYDMAIIHYEYALALLGTDIWEQHYQLAMDIYSNLAITHFLAGLFEQANTLFDQIIHKAKTPLDKAKIMNFRALLYSAIPRFPEAIAACEEGLRILGVKISKKPNKLQLLKLWLKINWHMRKKQVKDLLDLPIMQDQNRIMIMDLLQKLANTSYMSSPRNFTKPAYAIMLSVLYSIKYGNNSNSSLSYLLFGQIQIMKNNNIEKAYQFCELAIKLCEQFQETNLPLVYLGAMTRIFPWKLPYKDIVNYAVKTSELSYESGDLYSLQYSTCAIIVYMYYANQPFGEIDKKITAILANTQITSNDEITLFLEAFQYLIHTVTGKISLADYFKAINKINTRPKRTFLMGVVGTKVQELALCSLFEEWPHAMKIIEETKNNLLKKPLNQLHSAPTYYFYYALTLLSTYHKATFFNRFLYRKRLNKLLARLNFWQSHCPSNYAGLYYLIKAGIADMHGNVNQAIIDYDKSVTSFRENDRILMQAMAHEYMAKCYLRRNQPLSAYGYLQNAYAAYQQAGCKSKVTSLKSDFPQLVNVAKDQTLKTISSHHTASVLDIDSVLKSAQTISSKMKLEKLLETLIGIVMENAGAERVVLLLMENDKLIVEAEGKIETKPQVLQKQSIETRDDLALSIIQYVQNTQEPVVLGNAKESGSYTEDPYILQNKSLSILCAPILYQKYLFGILYIENNLVSDAFTQKHLELLKILSSQIAISLENARLYRAYDQFIPHEFLDILGKRSIIDISLGDNVQKEMSVLFTDIRGFSKLSEQLGPQEIFKFMNSYLGHMAPIIKNHGGFIDKYIGDAIMALFASDAASAIYAGIDMQKELRKYNEELIAQGKQPIAIGIGINSGNLTLGTLGSLNRIETSVLSDAVNLAERIQELTKKYDCRLLISGTTYQKLADPQRFDLRFIERTKVRGRDEIIDVWEVYNGDPDELKYAKLTVAKHYNEAIDFFLNTSYQKALTLFQRCLVTLPKDKVILNHINDCQKFLDMERSKTSESTKFE